MVAEQKDTEKTAEPQAQAFDEEDLFEDFAAQGDITCTWPMYNHLIYIAVLHLIAPWPAKVAEDWSLHGAYLG